MSFLKIILFFVLLNNQTFNSYYLDMEELLNKLIERGWYPFCDNNVKEIRIYSDMDIECIYWKRKSDFYYISYRKLASKESWLWQFVCKNKLLKEEVSICYEWWANVMAEDWCISKHEIWCREIHTNTERWYRIIESALKDEYELEDFLLSNIKVND